MIFYLRFTPSVWALFPSPPLWSWHKKGWEACGLWERSSSVVVVLLKIHDWGEQGEDCFKPKILPLWFELCIAAQEFFTWSWIPVTALGKCCIAIFSWVATCTVDMHCVLYVQWKNVRLEADGYSFLSQFPAIMGSCRGRGQTLGRSTVIACSAQNKHLWKAD